MALSSFLCIASVDFLWMFLWQNKPQTKTINCFNFWSFGTCLSDALTFLFLPLGWYCETVPTTNREFFCLLLHSELYLPTFLSLITYFLLMLSYAFAKGYKKLCNLPFWIETKRDVKKVSKAFWGLLKFSDYFDV